jgi:hypothetical protein
MIPEDEQAREPPNPSRRKFGVMLGAAAITPMVWENAIASIKPDGKISKESVLALLDAQGERGIYDNPDRLEELRTALTNKIQEHILIRDFPLPDDVEPLTGFHR